jgi:hypothetical protein
MAKILIALVLGLMVLAGCQQPGMVDSVPSPRFAGPTVAQAKPLPPAVSQGQSRTPAPRQVTPPVARVPQAWIPTVAPRPWQYIVIHHSASPAGGAVAFDRAHRLKGWDELGYHFVVGNGTDTPDGLVEVGPRWPKQKHGAHTKTPDNRFNEYGIGICLVGNFDVDRPTSAQLHSLAHLTAYLMHTYRIPPERVLGHRDCKPTHCPGQNFDMALLRRLAVQYAQEDFGDTTNSRTAQVTPPPSPAR